MQEHQDPVFSAKPDDLYIYTQENGIQYLDEKRYPALISFLESANRVLKRRTKRSLWSQFKLRRSIRKIHSESESSDEAISQSYDREYENRDSTYGYASAILSKEGFELITGVEAEAASLLRILDVGAGSNEFLRFCRDSLGISSEQLHGADVSRASIDIIEADQFTGHLGRLESLDLPPKSFDLIFLSYFIDYDTDQAATFHAAIDSVQDGGRIVIEGLFPVRPFALLEKDANTHSFITKGESAVGDIELVREAFTLLGREKGRVVSLERVMKTHRFVHSHYGFHRLPSYFLTFKVT